MSTRKGGYNTKVGLPSLAVFVQVSHTVLHAEDTRYTNPLKQKFKAKRLAAECTNPLKLSSCRFSQYNITADVGAAPVTRRPAVQMPDEYLPPNKILFLQNLPESVTKDQLNALFSQYPNLHEVRLVPSKKDIAFVEYLDEGSATVAKDALHNYKLDGENKIKVRGFTQCIPPIIFYLFPRSPLPGSKILESEGAHLTAASELVTWVFLPTRVCSMYSLWMQTLCPIVVCTFATRAIILNVSIPPRARPYCIRITGAVTSPSWVFPWILC